MLGNTYPPSHNLFCKLSSYLIRRSQKAASQESGATVAVSSHQEGPSEWDPPARWLPSWPHGLWGPSCQTVGGTLLQVWRAPCRRGEISEFLRRICRPSWVSAEWWVLCRAVTLEGRAGTEQRMISSSVPFIYLFIYLYCQWYIKPRR